jgi:hypothetical protein
MKTNSIKKYLGDTKLTSEFRGNFFNSKLLRKMDIRIGKVLKNDDEEAIFLVSKKGVNKRVYRIKVLRKVDDDIPGVYDFVNIEFETPFKAIKYYKSVAK